MIEPLFSPRQSRHIGWVLVILLIVGSIGGAWWAGLRVTLNPSGQLASARAQWQSAALDDYRAWVLVQLPLRANSVYRVTVENGTVTDAGTINPGTFRFDANPPVYDAPLTEGELYTVAGLFTLAERLAPTFTPVHFYTASSSHIQYNPAYGYPERIIENTCGLALNLVPACVRRYEVVRFEPLTTDG